MTHDVFNEQLMAFLEGETDDATRAEMERHALGCAECGALLADLRALRAESAKLPELSPSRDLWTDIASRIEAQVVPIGAAVPALGSPAARVAGRRWLQMGLAAAALVGAVGLGYLSGLSRTQTQVAAANSDLAAGDSAPAVSVAPNGFSAHSTDEGSGNVVPALAASMVSAQLAVRTMSTDYDREIARLRKLVDERRNQLDPATVAVIEKNLRVIDVAITESRKAIARDPASRFLIESLNQSLDTKVELLRIAAALPNRS
jgi:anti-sigma factor RsiW